MKHHAGLMRTAAASGCHPENGHKRADGVSPPRTRSRPASLLSFLLLVTLLCVSSQSVMSATVWKMASPRRDIGAGAVALPSGGIGLVVAGGCNDFPAPGPEGPYFCYNSSATVELYTSSGATNATVTPKILQLSVSRGWPAACPVGSQVVVAGGGTSTLKTPSADVIDVRAGKVVASFPHALSQSRWGHACATVDNLVFFGGGYGPVYDTTIDVYKADTNQHDGGDVAGSWSVAPFKLSAARESTGAVGLPSTHSVLFTGGWNDDEDVPNFATIDAFNTSTATAYTNTGKLRMPCYWPGVVNVGSLAYVLDDAYLNVINGKGQVVSIAELPAPLAGTGPDSNKPWESGGAVTDAHIPQNGVALFDCLACYYALRQSGEVTNAVFCYNTVTQSWLPPMNCTAVHKAGAIAGAGSTVFMAGGYNPMATGNPPTDVIDVFELQRPRECGAL